MNTKLYVGNLPFSTSETELRLLFQRVGNVRSITIPLDRETQRPRGFAFVEMETPDEATAAIRVFNGHLMGGRPLTVNAARPMEPRSGGGGRERNPRFGSGRRSTDRW
ncbi:MAG: RNA-binding protein [Thermoflexales bacterium]|nr:RNA-binding protein [Thermoflexales bacterium]MDW8291748.1 RNA-binding protein [Anaerolineae bacterium]